MITLVNDAATWVSYDDNKHYRSIDLRVTNYNQYLEFLLANALISDYNSYVGRSYNQDDSPQIPKPNGSYVSEHTSSINTLIAHAQTSASGYIEHSTQDEYFHLRRIAIRNNTPYLVHTYNHLGVQSYVDYPEYKLESAKERNLYHYTKDYYPDLVFSLVETFAALNNTRKLKEFSALYSKLTKRNPTLPTPNKKHTKNKQMDTLIETKNFGIYFDQGNLYLRRNKGQKEHWQNVQKRLKSLINEWASYTTKIEGILEYPLLSDLTNEEVQQLHLKLNKLKTISELKYSEFKKLDIKDTLLDEAQNAETAILRLRQLSVKYVKEQYSEREQRLLGDTEQLLHTMRAETAAPIERLRAYERLQGNVQRLKLLLPKTVTAGLQEEVKPIRALCA